MFALGNIAAADCVLTRIILFLCPVIHPKEIFKERLLLQSEKRLGGLRSIERTPCSARG